MNTKLGAKDIVKIAQGVEQREARWYTRTKEAAVNPRFHDTCSHLSDWHAREERFWAEKLQELARKADRLGQFSIEETALPDAAALAGLTWFGDKPQTFAHYHDWSHPETLLKAAAKRAQELMVFFEGLKGFATSLPALDAIDEVIGQEYRYLDYIGQLRL